jgi:transposase
VVAIFLRALLRHLFGPVIVVLDSGSIHKGPDVQALQARCPRLHLEWLPGYAPELNPDELVWAHFKTQLANGHPDTVEDLMATVCRITKRVTRRPDLIRSFIAGSALPAFL